MHVMTKPVPWQELAEDPRTIVIQIAEGDLVVRAPDYTTRDAPDGGLIKMWTPGNHRMECRRLWDLDTHVSIDVVNKLHGLTFLRGGLVQLTGRTNAVLTKICRLIGEMTLAESGQSAESNRLDLTNRKGGLIL